MRVFCMVLFYDYKFSKMDITGNKVVSCLKLIYTKLGHSLGDSLIHLMFITAVLLV